MFHNKLVGEDALKSSSFSGMSREAAPFAFLAAAKEFGIEGALVTICQINGGAPKPLGTHMAVLSDGRYLGYVSGGCVEPAIATEVAQVIASGKDQVLRFGQGSRFMDIRFPCGGGIDLLVHVAPDAALLAGALAGFKQRRPFSVGFRPEANQAWIADESEATTGWQDKTFLRRYRPRTKLLLIGRGPELEVLARVGAAAEYDLTLAIPDDPTAMAMADLNVPIQFLTTPSQPWEMPIDKWTATVLLFHEHEWEGAILARAAAADGFYVGALGSVRTHNLRRERLAAMGVSAEAIERIRGPIGMIDRAREPGILALSVLAEIATARSAFDGG
jgi:xanthine dehydrogenase accessory factor